MVMSCHLILEITKQHLRCFFQENNISDDILNCEYEGILGTIANTIGSIQANEILNKF